MSIATRFKNYFFAPRYHYSRFQFNLAALIFAVFGFLFATYFAAVKLPQIFATTTSSVTKDTDTHFSQGTLSSTSVSGSGSSAVVQLSGTAGPDGTQYQRTITVDNSSNSNILTEYQVLIDNLDTASLVSAGKMQSDCDDIRFTNTGGTALSYSIVGNTCNTTSTKIWVKVDSIAASSSTTIYLYYGSASASAGSSESDTFSYSSEKTIGYVLQTGVTSLQVISLADGNSISHNGTTLSLDKFGTGAFNSVNQFLPISSKKLFNADSSSDNTDMFVPISWAGTEFLLYDRSGGTHSFYAIAPWGTATVNIYNAGTLRCSNQTVATTGTTISCANVVAGQIRISSNVPILIFTQDSVTYDQMALHPSSTEKWIGSGGSVTFVLSNSSGADYRDISSADSSEQNPADLGADTSVSLTGGSLGAAPGFTVYSTNNPIGVHQYADGDGGDSHYYQLQNEMGTIYGSANIAEYISIASDQAATCTVYNNDGSQLAQATLTSTNTTNYFTGTFGTGASNAYTSGKWRMECTKPVAAFYQKPLESEGNIMTYPLMRQFTYPTPTVSTGSEGVALQSSGTWESPTNSNVIDTVWNGGWGDGTDGSTAFSATVANVGTNNTIAFAMRTAVTTGALTSASYITLGTVSTGTTFTKTKAELDALGIGTGLNRYVQVKATFAQTSDTNPQLDNFTLYYLSDNTAPETNATSIAMLESAGGTTVASNGWTDNSSPYFSWTAGADSEAGLKGYCLYLGADTSGNPSTAKGLLGTSPVSTTGTTCQFIVSGTSIDFATSTYKGDTWLSTSSSPYYLNVKAVDNAGNVFSGSSTQFQFRFDSTTPTNSSYISCASGNFSNVADMNFSWPTSGSAAATDANSGISGWQYQINSTAGSWNSLTTGSSYTLTSGTDGSAIVSGNNIIYFRSVDTAGNISSDSTIRTCNLAYGGAAPAFGGTDTVTVTPSTSTSNSYALSWPAATATSGQTVNHYYYMINTSPPSTLATLQGNSSTYVDNGTTRTVSAAALANVNKGTNTVYVVAIDNASTPNYSPSNYISGTFTLNSTDPDNVGSLVASDSSIKSSSQWNVTLTWVAPTYQGAGNLTYLIKRSTDNSTFTQVGTASGLSYVDNAPSSALYYYKVYTKDGADAQSSGTNAVSITPTGKWTSAPTLSTGPDSGSITTKKATITWTTSRSADSKIQYGTTSGSYGTVEPSSSSQTSSHSIGLTGLNPGTTYYYKAKWTDEDGNTGTSDEKSFTTASAPTVKDVSAKSIGLTTATIQYTSQNASKVKIYYGTTTSFGGAKEVSTSTSETTYTTELTGLADGTKYYYKINTFDSESSEYEGTILDFTTLPRPKISSVKIQEVKGTAQPTILVSWTTNTEVSSIITYYPEGKTSDARDEVNIALTKGEHKMFIKGLLPQTNYILLVKGRDKVGNEAQSDSQKVTTSTDTRPPQILNVKIEGGVIPVVGTPGQESMAQLVVSWDTDEPSTSQVEFGEGTGETYSQKTQEDSNLTTNHLVVISNLTPSKVYHLRAIAKDKAGNIGKSIDSVTITPKSTLSALDLVVGNLSDVFGFLNNVTK